MTTSGVIAKRLRRQPTIVSNGDSDKYNGEQGIYISQLCIPESNNGTNKYNGQQGSYNREKSTLQSKFPQNKIK